MSNYLQSINLMDTVKSSAYDSAWHEYLDIEVVNNSSNLEPQPIIFNQIKSSNVVDNCSDYFLSIVKWSLNSNIPQIIPKMMLDPTPLTPTTFNNVSSYYINIGYGTRPNTLAFPLVAQNVVFIPENKFITKPAHMPISQDEVYKNSYFHIYSVENFLEMVNNALMLQFNAMKANPAYSALLTNALAPLFVWNASTTKLELIISKEFIEGANTSINSFYISMNADLYNLFDTFPSACLNYTPDIGANFVLINRNTYGFNSFSTPHPDGGSFITMYRYSQQSSSVPSWVPVDSIQFTTTTLPVIPAQSGAPNYLGLNLKSMHATENSTNLLTDFTFPLDTGTEVSRALLYYIPSSEYRLIDLVGQQSLNNLNIICSWRDKLGFTHPLTLKNGANATMKILLRKKSFN